MMDTQHSTSSAAYTGAGWKQCRIVKYDYYSRGEWAVFFLVVSNLTFVFFGSEQFVKTLECWKERSIIENA